MRKFKLNCIGEQCSAPIENSKEKMQLTHRTDNMVIVRRISEHPKNGQSIDMEWDVFTKEEIKSLYYLITQEA
jgi:hypothetical protein